ncbi:autotransporter assembly complex protein TamA [Acinetobacter rathckeae]|uniref:autotransporter assembly complex protein TamA n=1 Tax=Acinetobacter rathckeae TaxID=2605272 RepID=UPI0018A28CD3|nr:autotransporter assembly complex family protein [Acinetobacter rathckeae]MBF7687109.1 outer membrane protein assembly factor [Acinetobacter rathckeae]MBF7694539.1 outer membrane protein assembly factor [Acinetobacter rathckeae]
MLLKTHFKKLRLVQHVQSILKIDDKPYLICIALLASCAMTQSFAQDTSSNSSQPNTQNATTATPQQVSTITSNTTDSMQLLQQQQQNPALTDFKPVHLGDLEQLPAVAVDPSMAQQILNEAAQAKQQAEINRQQGVAVNSQISAQTMQSLTDTSIPSVQVNQIITDIQTAHEQDLAQARANDANPQAKKGAIFNDTTFEIEPQHAPEKNIFKRWFNRLKPSQDTDSFVIPKITAEVQGAPPLLETNIKNKLSTFTQEAFDDESSAVPQLRTQVQQAAQAVGYYNAKFKFERLSNKKVKVIVEPNQPVTVASQNIEFFGAGKNLAQFQVIRLLPDLEVGDILNQGKYEQTKTRINDVASDNGFFDAYWQLHDLKIQLPENKADINLRYDTGQRYKLGDVEFRMSDSKKPFPLKMSVLKSMVPWQSGDDYAFWRVNTLANNLTNSRYFNWSLVETVKPDPISKPQDLPPDIQALVDEKKITQTQAQTSLQDESVHANQASKNKITNTNEPAKKQTVADEKQFAGAQERSTTNEQTEAQQINDSDQEKAEVRNSKKVPVIVTLNADKLNSAEVGVGYGTDTGFRLRTQYRRAIVNSYGHSFDANMEVSQIRQAVDTHYTIPYKHPINDYFNLVSGYEREEFTGVGPGMSLTTETAIAGAERVIRNPFGGWQQTFGFRYRLDKIHQIGEVNEADVPSAFLRPGSNPQQQALLLGYQISRTDSNDPLNPVKGFKQSYKIQLGSKSVVSDANMAILSADWAGIYSLGSNYDHQFIASAQLAYIFTDDFDNVPYNLRFFAGGDQSLRGFDYKSLSPEENGYKIGGQALAVGSLEYNYQFKEGWRAALFTDFGNAYNKDFSNPIAYSVGVGIRWRSPIGPIRLDVASGISDPGHPIRLHFFIGSQL